MRHPLSPIQTPPTDHPPPRRLKPKLLQPHHPSLGNRELSRKNPSRNQPTTQGDPEPTGKMVVTGTPPSQGLRHSHRPQPARRSDRPGKPSHALQQRSNVRPSQRHITVPPLPMLNQQSTLDQPSQMLTRGRRSHPGMGRQLTRRPSPTIQQSPAKRRTRPIGQQGSNLSKSLHSPILRPEHFGPHRTVAALTSTA